jgi:hypothetical protein
VRVPASFGLLALAFGSACTATPTQVGPTDGGRQDAFHSDPRAAICTDPAASAPPYRLIQQIFDVNCTSCHASAPMVNLSAGASWNDLVQQSAPTPESCGGVLVVPGQPSMSYLFEKLTTATPCYGRQMPMGEFASDPLPTCVTEIVRAWIEEGAPPPPGDAGTD